MEKKKLAIFDFDGTITSRDSMIEFIRYYRGDWALKKSYFVLAWLLIPAKLRLINREAAKKRFLKYHLGGETKENLANKARLFCIRILPNYLREKALDQMQFHRQHQHEIIVVTASLDIWVEPWIRHMNLDFISTKAAYENGVFNGNFETPNCSGEEKVNRLREVKDLESYECIFGYGDSSEDKAFLKIAHRRFFRPFRTAVKKAIVE